MACLKKWKVQNVAFSVCFAKFHFPTLSRTAPHATPWVSIFSCWTWSSMAGWWVGGQYGAWSGHLVRQTWTPVTSSCGVIWSKTVKQKSHLNSLVRSIRFFPAGRRSTCPGPEILTNWRLICEEKWQISILIWFQEHWGTLGTGRNYV